MVPLHRLKFALATFRAYDEIIPSQRIEVFLLVALRGHVTREDVCEEIGVGKASAYRNLMALSAGSYVINVARHQGLELLTAEPDPIDSRRTRWRLSAKGERVTRQLDDIITNGV